MFSEVDKNLLSSSLVPLLFIPLSVAGCLFTVWFVRKTLKSSDSATTRIWKSVRRAVWVNVVVWLIASNTCFLLHTDIYMLAMMYMGLSLAFLSIFYAFAGSLSVRYIRRVGL